MDRETQERMRLDWPTGRTIDALENIAAEMERLRLLKKHELGARQTRPTVQAHMGHRVPERARGTYLP
jgi:hypothetical protein